PNLTGQTGATGLTGATGATGPAGESANNLLIYLAIILSITSMILSYYTLTKKPSTTTKDQRKTRK
ncbi:hypothetical protein JW865_02730, partial [Candidatus Bathyarchaeota archaeon]|nr:hypothetical protein [Candidatus Bathyarchaeota archaeon]